MDRRPQPNRAANRQVARRFREQIISGTLQPGDRLPSITSLQRELGYARATIAKALHLLAEEGLIYQPLGLPYYVRGGGYQPLRPPGGHGSSRRDPHAKPGMPVTGYAWRGSFTNTELNDLHAEGFSHPVLDDDWQTQFARHSLGWVTARHPDRQLAGFINSPGTAASTPSSPAPSSPPPRATPAWAPP
jgi:DNA-binding transcriptional MocR family regulator